MRHRLPRRIKGFLKVAIQRWRHQRSLNLLRSGSSEDTPRVLTIAGWTFPLHSQTFVYEELRQIQQAGFTLRLAYSGRGEAWELAPSFRGLNSSRVWLAYAPSLAFKAMQSFRKRYPERVEVLYSDLEEVSGLSHEELEAHRDVGRGFLFAQLAEGFRADYLHSYFFYEGSLACFIASRLLGIPRGISCYADHQLYDYPLKATTLQLKEAALVVATSERIRQELKALAPNLEDDRLLLKPNAIDCERFPAAPRESPGGSKLQLLSVSRLDPKKGLSTLLEAVNLLKGEGIPLELRIVGGADAGTPGSVEYARDLQGHIRTLGVENQVQCLGPLGSPAVRRELASAQIFVAPYEETARGDKDGIPTSLLEAMATGLPVISTHSGSIPELVTHQKDGLLVPTGNPQALARAILSLARSPEDRARLGRAAAATVRERFDVRQWEPLLHEKIWEVVKEATAPP